MESGLFCQWPVHGIPKTVRKIRKFKANVTLDQNFSTKIKNENEAATKVIFQVAHLLAKQEKLYTNYELIKLYLIAAAKKRCPEEMNLFGQLAFP